MYAGDSESHLEGKKRHVPTIGLNETKLGIAAPPWMGQLMVRTIGFRQAERALALGTLFPPDQALKVGLVDDVVGAETVVDDLSDGVLQELLPGSLQDHNYDSVLQVAYQEALKYAKIHSQARVASKLVTRSDFLKDLTVNREADTEHFCGFIGQDLVQKNLRGYVQALKKRSKKN